MEQLLKRNENENNELVSNVFLGLSGLVLTIWLLAIVGIFEVDFNIISSFAMTLWSWLHFFYISDGTYVHYSGANCTSIYE